jgi:hypothetical protein
MNTLEKSGAREIAARIIVASYEAEVAILNAVALLPDTENTRELRDTALASQKSLRDSVASWMFDPEKHCHFCYEASKEVIATCHEDLNACRECLISTKDENAIAFYLRD